jgi:XTP/dITP diphosphohydrolase
MKRVVVVATRNPHKLAEIRRILPGTGLAIRSLREFPPLPKVRENGDTLQANAVKKAKAVSAALHLPALADDSGLFVPALHGQPGVRSARYAGAACDYAANNRKLLRRMRELTGRQRRAFFATAVALVWPGRRTSITLGRVWGTILSEPRGQGGFGYDPVFKADGMQRTFAELTPVGKNRISHRARALRKMAARLKRIKLAKEDMNR